MIAGLRGYNTIHGLWRTDRRERGLVGPPNDFYEVRGNASTEMDYEQFCAALENAGVNWLRVKLTGWNNPIGAVAASFEPPPRGTFNIWHSALNPANLTQYRADQIAPPIPEATRAASNIGEFCVAAERHGIKLYVLLFDNREFYTTGWTYHAWNQNCRYINGVLAQPQDRGFLAEGTGAFDNPMAMDAARRRIDAALAAFDGYDVIGCWGLMAEQTWLAAPERLGTTWGSAEHVAFVRTLRDWNEVMCRYVQARHPAPVGVDHAFPADVRRNTIRAELYDAPSLDWVGINAYGYTDVAVRDWMRDAAARYPGKQIVVEQYHPNGTDTDPSEEAPYRASKRIEWAVACGTPGMVGPLRWPETKTATYASPWMREIAGITAQMATDARPQTWAVGRAWDGRVQSADLAVASTWGDGKHVSAYLRWLTDGEHRVELSGMRDGEYIVRWYDYLNGDVAQEIKGTVSGGAMVLNRAITRERVSALLVVPAVGPSSSASASTSPSPSTSASTSASASASESVSSSSSGSSSQSASVSPSGPVVVRLVVEDDVGAVQSMDLEEGRDYTIRVETE